MPDIFKILIFCLFSTLIVRAQNRVPPPPCYANGNFGAGGVIGNGIFLHTYEGNTIQLAFSSQQDEVSFNDILVIYIATDAPGRAVIDDTVDDNADNHRIAITNSNINNLGSTISFPPGFEAAFAIAIDTSSGKLYSIPASGAVGNGDLMYLTSVNSTLTSSNQTNFSINFNASDIGLNPEEEFYLVAIYVGNDGFTYDEGYGDGISPGTQGSNNVTFSAARSISPEVGCESVLSAPDFVSNITEIRLDGTSLVVKGLSGNLSVKAFSINGKQLLNSSYTINDSASIPLNLPLNQVIFMAFEGENFRQVLKVITPRY